MLITSHTAYGRKAVIYATCFRELHNGPEIGVAACKVLARNEVRNRGGVPALLRHAAT